jgi:UDP-glucuronate 4-epimerase
MSVLVTGAAGFIGYHVAAALLDRGARVIGVDNLDPYYDVALKQARIRRLEERTGFQFHFLDITDRSALAALLEANAQIDRVCHMAAQAGVRHSLEDPYVYVNVNVMGQVTVLETARRLPRLRHLVYASSSSVYGGNVQLPFSPADRVDHPVSLYAATKRAGELVAESYAHLHALPLTGLRFFTVYGPWGRPDMSAVIFARAILEGRPIQVFNNGEMRRDFTYIDDVVAGVLAALERPPQTVDGHRAHHLYNIGNHRAEDLLRFIAVIEKACGRSAVMEMTGMQPGDVPATYADIEDSIRDLGFFPRTTIDDGIPRLVAWVREYYGL